MQIGNFNTDKKVFVIAELSANHAGSLELALESIKAAKKAGADCIKIQTYTPDSLTLNSDKEDFIIKGGLWDRRRLYELYEHAKTPYEWHSQIFEAAQNEGILCFSSPFAKKDVDFLKRFDPIAYKIASFEANDEDFIRYIAKENKPSIISTGIATQEELFKICEIFKEEKNPNLIFLKCTSAYPAAISDMNLKALVSLKEKFQVEVGLSDHSLGFLAPVMAVALGARIIEKHFTLDKSIQSEDMQFSLDFHEFKAMVDAIRQAESALGDGDLNLNEKVLKNRIFARSLYASKDIKKGEIFNEENVRSVRPSLGLHPKFYKDILGKVATKDIKLGDALKKEDFR
ncbi:pseudaminic acid synthase [Campylobacter sp. VicNov18]|uniref:pseudaminic acid synthase n=1 Tax=Campylobacter bilis TaxID=2691918 RepID=UPI00130E6712|nr:pseudaminic acid synthase [Campylobacter bilis]MPV64222.1 pseudaminic acid synthase [Campylobacter hepaticus]MBM0637727.1 pseudaminic acid synthase [Campylobacter bilis]MCC8278452.1 pseudaminic acid synthase [Campylobacter bilis]MCC8299956.1 pseudaminic acid synthase [Campylobacter bilis]MCC8301361.1 pseudaminic acid synthase [Campylobacter bilis]